MGEDFAVKRYLIIFLVLFLFLTFALWGEKACLKGAVYAAFLTLLLWAGERT